MATELYHYGRKGMKWYQHIYSSVKNESQLRKAKKYVSDKDARKQLKKSYRNGDPHAKNAVAYINEAFYEVNSGKNGPAVEHDKKTAKTAADLHKSYKNLSDAYSLARSWWKLPRQQKAEYGYKNEYTPDKMKKDAVNKSAFGKYLRDNGTNISDYEKKTTKAIADFQKAAKAHTEALVGQFGKVTLVDGTTVTESTSKLFYAMLSDVDNYLDNYLPYTTKNTVTSLTDIYVKDRSS